MDDDRGVRLLRADQMRAAFDVARSALHGGPVDDRSWEAGPVDDCVGRSFGAYDGGELVGTSWSFPSRTAVPGGAAPTTAAITRVGVRADRTRRGHLTALMRAQLADAAARGEVLATLTASETAIYGRFGFGVATRSEDLRVPAGAALRAAAPGGGTLRMLPVDRALDELVALYGRLAPVRAGTMARTPEFWTRIRSRTRWEGAVLESVVHTGPDGDDGFATWTVEHGDGELVVRVLDLFAAGPAATVGLWRFLLGLDLAGRLEAERRPRDELDLVLADPRHARVVRRPDDLWMRLLDVPAALAARTWGEAEPVVLRVRDPMFTANDAAHRLGPDGPKQVDDDPDLECDVDALAMAYLGDRRPSELVATGWWRAREPSAVARADALFATGSAPWCGTMF